MTPLQLAFPALAILVAIVAGGKEDPRAWRRLVALWQATVGAYFAKRRLTRIRIDHAPRDCERTWTEPKDTTPRDCKRSINVGIWT